MSEHNNVIVSICGPSTSGKTELSKLLKIEGFSGVVTTTTRPQRSGETHGINYYFVSEDKFNSMKSSGELLENVNVNGYQYGVSLQGLNDALKKGIDCVIVLEPDGANILEKYCKKNNIVNIKVYVNNPIPVLLDRLKTRFKEDKNASQGDYKDRLFNIVFFEPENWTEKALNGEHNYDLIFQTFDQTNTNEVLHDVINKVNKSKKNNKSPQLK